MAGWIIRGREFTVPKNRSKSNNKVLNFVFLFFIIVTHLLQANQEKLGYQVTNLFLIGRQKNAMDHPTF